MGYSFGQENERSTSAWSECIPFLLDAIFSTGVSLILPWAGYIKKISCKKVEKEKKINYLIRLAWAMEMKLC